MSRKSTTDRTKSEMLSALTDPRELPEALQPEDEIPGLPIMGCIVAALVCAVTLVALVVWTVGEEILEALNGAGKDGVL